MQKMSGADISFIIREIIHLRGKRISRIRKTPQGIFLFKIGSDELLFQPGIRLHITRQVLEAAPVPDQFTAFLRKNIEGKTAQEIRQHNMDRIVEITTRSKGLRLRPSGALLARRSEQVCRKPAGLLHRLPPLLKPPSEKRLIFEIFRRGNIILTDESGTILSCLQKDEAGGRKIAKGEKYEYPKPTAFQPILPQKIAFLVQENEKGEPVSFSLDASAGGKKFPSFSEALDYYYASQKEESEAQKAQKEKIRKLEVRLKKQLQAIDRLNKEKEDAKKAGEAIYINFEKIERLISLVREMKKAGRSEQEIEKELTVRIKGTQLEVELT